MAGGGLPGGRGRRNVGQDNLNLVPFIDLFSTLIIFLITNSVLEHLSVMPVTMGTNESGQVSMPKDKTDLKKITSDLRVSISNDAIVLIDQGKSSKFSRDEMVANKFEQVRAFAEAARTKYESKNDVVIAVDDKAVYEDLVGVMDQFLAFKFDQLVVMGNQ